MRLPQPLLRNNKRAYKNQFGHILILAGSPGKLGAAALCGLAAMRSGAGLVTIGIPKSLNLTLQKKISPVIMTWPLDETKEGTLALSSWHKIQKRTNDYSVLALGPGLTMNASTKKIVRFIIQKCNKPLVIDADGLNALAEDLSILKNNSNVRILTPHPGEMARLTRLSKSFIEKNRKIIAHKFAIKHHCVLVLKGHQTVIAGPTGQIHLNKTGNPGMATAGSGDVLTGMISAILAQGLKPFEATKWAVRIHGQAGDAAAKNKSRTAMIATDLIDFLPQSIKKYK